MALVARDRAVDVVADPDELGEPRDVLLTQDAAMAYELADRYPGVPQVFVNHSNTFDPQLPPLVPGVVDAVVVMSERFRRSAGGAGRRPADRPAPAADRHRAAGAPPAAPSEVPRRALLLGNYLTGDARRLIVDTWSDLGVEVVQVGTGHRPTLAARRSRSPPPTSSSARPARCWTPCRAAARPTSTTPSAATAGSPPTPTTPSRPTPWRARPSRTSSTASGCARTSRRTTRRWATSTAR